MELFSKLSLLLLFLYTASALGPITHMCDFETDDCGYINDETDNYDWKRRRLLTGGLLSGPIGDHTTGLGSFMYADARDGKSGSIARIMTPLLAGSNDEPSSLLTFWFSMWSLNPLEMGTLNVYVRYNDVINPIPVWSTSGVQNAITEWVEAKVLLTSNDEFQIVFESVRGRGSRSDIAIDDIQVINSDIPRQCDFEDSAFGPMCTWYQELFEDDFDWTWHSGETPTLDTGPLVDNTYENETGHYFYIEGTRDSREVTAQLKTYPMFNAGGMCTITFWYHAYGDELGTALNPPLALIVNGDVMSVTGATNSDPAWRRYSESTQAAIGSYQIIIEGRRRGNSGDVAIDDVIISNNCIDIDKCASNPCWNGGTCTQSSSQFFCECVPGYTGLHCQFDIDECGSSPCEEPRVCVDRVNRYECVCEEGFGGENCEEDLNDEPAATETIPFNAYRTPVIIGACCMAGAVLIVTILIAVGCTRGSGKGGSSIDSGSIQNPPTAKELAMKNMASENKAYQDPDPEEASGSSASGAKEENAYEN